MSLIRCLVALSLLALLAVVSTSQVTAVQMPGTTVSKTARDVRLTLAVSRQSYPKDALVRVTVTLQNVSHHPVNVGATSAPECVRFGPGVEVLDGDGTVLYPPAVPWLMASCGPPILPRSLLPGHTLRRATLTVLRGAIVRGVASIGRLGQAHAISTPPLHITFTSEPPPKLTIRTKPTLEAVVTPSVPASGDPFYFNYGIFCPAPGTASKTPRYGNASVTWERGSVQRNGSFISSAFCPFPVRWVFAGGWLNHPVVSLDYP